VKVVRFAHLLIGLLVIVFAWATAPTWWGRIVLTLLGLLQIMLAFMEPKRAQPKPVPPPPPPPPPEPPKPEPQEEAPKSE